ncbi:AraC family transcriptional regulator [Anaerocolumna sp. MB42-C2]|uniref:AraC family transcriptional regulator n=1 Tax=Anaerocolumna sp. MB42-C2 TaxID=3070997 RepID=UPI0027E1A274|nr:AraC family transcriptional regulator [Anaerocolumna sp. MB42-C2]WMJ87297.1 AraC family transcriptional regulator [Anaerocolumna sp. MB42-C2]
MHDLSLYEKKIINDEEFPVQMFENRIRIPGTYCHPHWHEHLELHYVLKGNGIFYCNQKPLPVKEGSLVIINSNEIHEGISYTTDFHALVIIFEMGAFSKEIANYNVIFQSLIEADVTINELIMSIYEEENEKVPGYKVAMKGKLYELIAYLLRNYVAQQLSEKESISRIRNLSRLNTVIKYIQENYTEVITNSELADKIHISEYRFCHLFKEIMGQSPLNYINEVRLKKAYYLLDQKEMTVSQVAAAVGFQDYNNFGRLFRKHYGYPPTKVWG